MSEPITWITKNGKHIPIYADKPTEEEQRKNKQIEQNEQYAKQKNRPDVTKEDIKKALLGDGPNYMDDPEYKELSKQFSYYLDQEHSASEELHKVKEQLRTERTPKPKEQWDEEDEFNALIGQRPMNYTEKGKELKKRYDELLTKWSDANSAWSRVREKSAAFDAKEGKKQREAYLRSNEFDGLVKPAKGEYFGFKTSESTTSMIDDMIKSGKAKIVEMPPKMYLHEIAHNIFEDSTFERSIRGTSVENINKYMRMMEAGVKFDTPYLNYKNKGQEGRHRAIAAYMLGVEKIPVIIVNSH